MVAERGQAAVAYRQKQKAAVANRQTASAYVIGQSSPIYGRLLWPKIFYYNIHQFYYYPINHHVTELNVINIAVTVSAKTLHLHVQVSWFCSVFKVISQQV